MEHKFKTTVEYTVGGGGKELFSIEPSQLVLAGNSPQCLIKLPQLKSGEVLFYLYQDHRGFDISPAQSVAELRLNDKPLDSRTRLEKGDEISSWGITLRVVSVHLPEATPTAVWDSNRGIRPVVEDVVVDSLLSSTRGPQPGVTRGQTSLDSMIPKDLMEAGLSGGEVPSFKMEFHNKVDTPVKAPAINFQSSPPETGPIPCFRCLQGFEGTRAQKHWFSRGGDRKLLVCESCKDIERRESYRAEFISYGFEVEEALDSDGGPGRAFKARNSQGELIFLRAVESAFLKSPISSEVIVRGLEALRDGLVEHPHVPTMLDCKFNDDYILISESWFEGKTLEELNSQQPLTWRHYIPILCRVLEVLITAHAQGVYHGSLTASRVMYGIVNGDQAKVMVRGFGLVGFQSVRDIGAQNRPFTEARIESVPTAFEKDGFEAQVDLYHLGMLSFRLLAGVPPFKAKNWVDLNSKMSTEDPLPLTKFKPELPQSFSDYVARLLGRTFKERHKSAREALTDLLELKLV